MEVEKLIRKHILDMSSYSSARNEYKETEGIFLDANENPFGNFNRYPDPDQMALKQVLAKLKNCKENQLFIGNGSDEIIDLAFRIFCNPNQDKALTFTPTYGMYKVAATFNEVELIQLPLNSNFQIDLSALLPFLEDEYLKLIFICSPNNPTGNLIKPKQIDFILNHFKGIVIIDEAYIDFSIQKSYSRKLVEYPNLIVLQTLSKAWGLAGLRLGIGLMNPTLGAVFNKVKPPYNVSDVNQKLALKALKNVARYQKTLNCILLERKNLITHLSNLKGIQKIYPSDANFILIRVKNSNQLYEQLIQKKIIVRNRNSVVKNCLRISIGTKDENKKLINALKKLGYE